ncbi:MAG: mechanosensitive ion channel [Phycisphaerales bacterium]|nr:mechanosensitive ion channel [Phycisphaerales bacterium]
MILLQINQQVEKSLSYLDKLKNELIVFAPKLIGAIIFFIIGRWLIGKLCNAITVIFNKRSFEPSLQSFLSSLIRISLMIVLLFSIAGIIGINITGFAALLAGAGIAIGSALNGSLGNLAGGVMILIFKPFKVKDFIEAQGNMGEVTEIGIFNTFMTTPERKTVILPNGALSTGVIINYTTSGSLRVDIPIAIAPSTSIEQARQVAITTMLHHPLVLKDPAPQVVVTKIGDGMVTLSMRPSAQQADYPTVFVEIQEMVKNAFDTNGIKVATPHS